MSLGSGLILGVELSIVRSGQLGFSLNDLPDVQEMVSLPNSHCQRLRMSTRKSDLYDST